MHTKYVNLQWNEGLKTDDFVVTTGYQLYRGYIYIEGFRFVTPLCKTDEGLDYYKDTIYRLWGVPVYIPF